MKRLLSLLPLLLLLSFLAPPTYATPAFCNPTSITSASVYTNYQTTADTFIAFSYDIAAICYPATTNPDLSIALVPTTELYGTNALVNKEPMPANVAVSDVNLIHGLNWMAGAITAVEPTNWSAFYFDLRLARVGNPGILEILLAETKAGGGADQYEPLDAFTILGRGSYNANRLPLAPTVIRIYFDSGPTLAAGTNNYALVLRAPDGNIPNHVIWRVETGVGASLGSASVDSGVTWLPIGGNVQPHAAWYGRDLATGISLFSVNDILVEYRQEEFLSDERTGGLYWPADITPTPDHDLTIPDYVLAIINRSTSPTEPEAVYRLDDACQIVLTSPLPSGFLLEGLSSFIDQRGTAATGIPFLELLMGEGGSLSTNLGLPAVGGFLLIALFFSLLLMAITAKFFPNHILVLLVGLFPFIILTMNNLMPPFVLLVVGLFVVLYVTWRTMVKSDV